MSALELIGILAIVCFFNVFSFIMGAKIGQKVSKGETIDMGIKNPVQAYDEYKEREEQKKILERQQTVAENIDNYDGTSLGQKDLPIV